MATIEEYRKLTVKELEESLTQAIHEVVWDFENALDDLRAEAKQDLDAANAAILTLIKERLFPFHTPAKELSQSDLAFICEQFEKLEF